MQICLKLVVWHSLLYFNSFAPVIPMSHEIFFFFLAARSSLISSLWPVIFYTN